MIKPRDLAFIARHAYVPEHMIDYAVAVSGAEPFLAGPFVYYLTEGHLIFVAYPLAESYSEGKSRKGLEAAISRFNPHTVTLLAPSLPTDLASGAAEDDHYYRLEVTDRQPGAKVRNMIKRAEREIDVQRGGAFGREHESLVGELMGRQMIDGPAREIFARLPAYLAASPTATVIEARDRGGELVAFDVAEYGAGEYGFYMFNFASRTRYVPGASDLLFSALLDGARRAGKRYLNLGLGINRGVAFFKLKWGAEPFLAHRFVRYERKQAAMQSLLGRLW